uniref:TonB-dependent receptor plug domain-containing protein n=1 Tax=uncultured Acinetobacter sp. TaxID=165433 RepID=UPI0026393438|nr:TonB-dependent receptor [uncultured Acinetobacter sp.]
MSKVFQPATLAGAISIALISTISFANTETNVIKLETIFVTASKSAQNIKDIPARVTVIDEKTIQQNPIANLSNLIILDPSIYTKQSGGIGQISELSLRGTSPAQTLVLQNSARLNNQNNLSPLFPAFLDTSHIQHVEILKGPASVQYGSDAIGGVINMITTQPSKTGTQITGVYGENNTYKTILNADYVDDSGLYAQIGGQRLESDGTSILDIQNEKEKASYDQKGYYVKFGYYQQDSIDSSLEINQNKGRSIFYNFNTSLNNAARDFKNQVINAKTSYLLNSDLTINARYSNVQDQQYLPNDSSYFNTESNEGDLNLKWDFLPQQNILFGLNYLDAEYETTTITNGKQTVDSLGYYIQHQYQKNGLSTQAGIRLEDNEKYGTHTVGQMAARYQLLPLTSIYANIGTAFRAPSLNELYTQWGGNDKLKPEESISYEIGFDQKLNYGLSTSLSAYYTEIDNLIDSKCIEICDGDWVTTYPVYQNINIDKAKLTGSEFNLKWSNNLYYINTQYAYIRSINDAKNRDIAYRPRQRLTLTAGYDYENLGMNAAIIARSKANSSHDNSNSKVSGVATIDLNAYWNINPNVKLFSNIQNVGNVRNQQVYNSGSWYINSGRLASAGVTLRY